MYFMRPITLPAPIDVVFPYFADLSNIFEWDPNVIESGRLELGPVRPGSRFELAYRMGLANLTLQYELVTLEPNHLLSFEGCGEGVQLTDRLRFTADGDQTRLTYEAQVEPKRAAAALVLRPFMERVADSVARRLAAIFEPETTEDRLPDSSLNPGNLSYRFTSPGWNAARGRFRATPVTGPRRVVITGPTSGLGRSAAWTLAGRGCDLVLIGRSQTRLEQVRSEMTECGFRGVIDLHVCDLGDLAAVRDTGAALVADGRPVDVLINNAGALFDEPQAIDGVERTTVVDFLSPVTLACALHPLLKVAGGTVVNVVSGGLYGAKLNLGHLIEAPRPFSGAKAYAQAKRALLILTERLNTRWEADGVRVHAMHPGWADTPGVRSSLPRFYKITKPFLRTPFAGIDTAVWLALTNPAPGGRLWFDRAPAPEHLFPWTRETPEDRARLQDRFAVLCD